MAKRVLKFDEDVRRLLLRALKSHYAFDVDRAILRLEEKANASRLGFRKRPLSIERYSSMMVVCATLGSIYWEIDLMGGLLERRFDAELERRQPKRKGSVSRKGFVKAIGVIDESANRTYNHFFEKAWFGTSPRDRAFRELCVSLGTIWEEEVGAPLPDINAFVATISFQDTPHPEHPLWLVFSALEISIDGRSIKDVIRYANKSIRPIGGVPDFIQNIEVRESDLEPRNISRNF